MTRERSDKQLYQKRLLLETQGGCVHVLHMYLCSPTSACGSVGQDEGEKTTYAQAASRLQLMVVFRGNNRGRVLVANRRRDSPH